MTGINKIVDMCEEKLIQEKINTFCLYVGKHLRLLVTFNGIWSQK